MDLEIIILTEIIQIQKDNLHVLSQVDMNL